MTKVMFIAMVYFKFRNYAFTFNALAHNIQI